MTKIKIKRDPVESVRLCPNVELQRKFINKQVSVFSSKATCYWLLGPQFPGTICFSVVVIIHTYTSYNTHPPYSTTGMRAIVIVALENNNHNKTVTEELAPAAASMSTPSR